MIFPVFFVGLSGDAIPREPQPLWRRALNSLAFLCWILTSLTSLISGLAAIVGLGILISAGWNPLAWWVGPLVMCLALPSFAASCLIGEWLFDNSI